MKETNPLLITEIPKDWILIEIPHPWYLDPYGYAREHGFDIEQHLKEMPIQQHLKARALSWEETGIPALIKENKKRLKQEERNRPQRPREKKEDMAEKKVGRKR